MPQLALEAKPEQLPGPPIAGADGNPVKENDGAAEAPETPHPNQQQEHSKEDAATFVKTKKRNHPICGTGRTYVANVRKAIGGLECVEAAIMTEEPGDPKKNLIVRNQDDNGKGEGQMKPTANATFEAIQANADATGILKLIKKICYNKFEAQQFPALAAVRAAAVLYKTKKGDLTTNIEWFEQFDNLSTAAEACGPTAKLPGITEYIMARDYGGTKAEDLTDMQLTDNKTKTTNMTLATIYIENSNHGCYSAIKQKLENGFLMGQNNYPATMTETHNILTNYRHSNRCQKPTTGNGAVAFTQQGNQNRDKCNITYFRCGQKGRYTWEGKFVEVDAQAYREKQQQREKDQPQQQPAAEETGIAQLNVGKVVDGIDDFPYQLAFCTFLGQSARRLSTSDHTGMFQHQSHTKDAAVNYDIVLSQRNGGHIDKNWLLLNNQSTVNVVCNPDLLTNI
eukprot:jgi/Psemu1/51155/gm1.51155_g